MKENEVEAVMEYADALIDMRSADSGHVERERFEMARRRLMDTATFVPQSGMVFEVQSGRGFVYEGGLPVETKEIAYRR